MPPGRTDPFVIDRYSVQDFISVPFFVHTELSYHRVVVEPPLQPGSLNDPILEL